MSQILQKRSVSVNIQYGATWSGDDIIPTIHHHRALTIHHERRMRVGVNNNVKPKDYGFGAKESTKGNHSVLICHRRANKLPHNCKIATRQTRADDLLPLTVQIFHQHFGIDVVVWKTHSQLKYMSL
jgi:hypothetical protein